MIKTRTYQQCLRCVMDTTDPQIRFDSNGYCNHCTDLLALFKHPSYAEKFNEQRFQRLVQKIKKAGKGAKFDCVLGLSGGVDSSYLAHTLKQHGLRVLLVHMDNGWNSEEAVRNIKSIVDTLNLSYEAYVLDWEEFKDLQRAFLKASVVEAETPTDIAIVGALHRAAADHGIKYVVSAGNMATEGILPADWHYDAKDMKYLRAIHSLYGTGRLKHFPTFSFWEEVWYKFIRQIRIVYPLNYIPFSKAEAIRVLVSEMNWRDYGAKHYESRYTKFVQSYLLPMKFNIDYRKATFSSQICSGSMTRVEALANLDRPLYNEDDIEREKSFVAKKLDFTKDELEHILRLPAKSYRDYPNNKKRLDFLYRMYRKIISALYKRQMFQWVYY